MFSLVFSFLLLIPVVCCTSFWPVPQRADCASTTGMLMPTFKFVATGTTNSILERAFTRYTAIILDIINQKPGPGTPGASSSQTTHQVSVSIGPDTTLNSQTNETYVLLTNVSPAQLKAPTVYGAIRGLETFSQMIHAGGVMDLCAIKDFPRFQYRGFLHDSARHYLSITVLKELIDALAYNKMNVFHWHVVDDQSFPIVIESLPGLAGKGAYGELESHRYTPAQVQDLIEYARDRGVRVVPEFDTPGHSTSWGKGYPDILTDCYGTDGKPNGETGPLNPVHPATFTLLQTLFNEVASVFLDDYVHAGGDEVPFSCWQSNPAIQQFMKSKGWTDYSLLENYYEQKLIQTIESTKKRYIVWQEVFQNGITLNKDAIVDVWKSGYKETLGNVTKAGFQAILSATWYLNYINDPYHSVDGSSGDWAEYYAVDPQDFPGTEAQKALVIGGEGTMWGEFVNNANVVSRTWPRASAVAERLWSAKTVTNVADADVRLQAHACRMNARGVAAEAIHTGDYCEPEYSVTYRPPGVKSLE